MGKYHPGSKAAARMAGMEQTDMQGSGAGKGKGAEEGMKALK